MDILRFVTTSEKPPEPQQLVAAASRLQREIENEGALRFISDTKILRLALELLNNPPNDLSQTDKTKLANLSACVVERVAEEMKWSRARKIASAVYRVFHGGTSRPITLFKLLPPEEIGKVVAKLEEEYNAVFASKEGDAPWNSWKWVRKWKCETLQNSIEDMQEYAIESKSEFTSSKTQGKSEEQKQKIEGEINPKYESAIRAISSLKRRIGESVRYGEYKEPRSEKGNLS